MLDVERLAYIKLPEVKSKIFKEIVERAKELT
jgi:hypothetical protein